MLRTTLLSMLIVWMSVSQAFCHVIADIKIYEPKPATKEIADPFESDEGKCFATIHSSTNLENDFVLIYTRTNPGSSSPDHYDEDSKFNLPADSTSVLSISPYDDFDYEEIGDYVFTFEILWKYSVESEYVAGGY